MDDGITGTRVAYCLGMEAAYLISSGLVLLGMGETVPPTCNIIATFIYCAFGLLFFVVIRPYKLEMGEDIWPLVDWLIKNDQKVSLPKLALLCLFGAMVGFAMATAVVPLACGRL